MPFWPQKKFFIFPHLGLDFLFADSFVFIFAFIVLATVMTHLVPAGIYDRIVNSAGQEVVDPATFRYVEASPVSLFLMFKLMVQAFVNTSDIIFCVMFAYCFVGILLRADVFQALFAVLIRKLKSRAVLMIPGVILFFALLGSLAGLAEEAFGLFPVCIALALALGYDELVGASIGYLAIFTGFASATFNPYTIGVAQSIADVPLYSGLGLRVVCFVLFVGILITWTLCYGAKIKKDPTSSLMYGTVRDSGSASLENIENVRLTTRQGLCIALFALVVGLILFGSLVWGWYVLEIGGVFLAASLVAAAILGWNPNQIAERMVEIGSETVFCIMVIGLSNAICLIMQEGRIIDTIVHALASLLEGTSGYVSALLMLIVQNLLNFFIPSGPGQAAVSMPIMAPLADAMGLSRQLSVLAFQFGDGYSNIFWPTMVFMMCGIMKIPVSKWYRYLAPLFGLMFLAQVLMICVAVAIGY